MKSCEVFKSSRFWQICCTDSRLYLLVQKLKIHHQSCGPRLKVSNRCRPHCTLIAMAASGCAIITQVRNLDWVRSKIVFFLSLDCVLSKGLLLILNAAYRDIKNQGQAAKGVGGKKTEARQTTVFYIFDWHEAHGSFPKDLLRRPQPRQTPGFAWSSPPGWKGAGSTRVCRQEPLTIPFCLDGPKTMQVRRVKNK